MGLKQTLDISLEPYDRCKKSIKKIGVRIRPLHGIIFSDFDFLLNKKRIK